MIAAQRICLANSAWVTFDFSAVSGPFVSPPVTLMKWQSSTYDLAQLPCPEGSVFSPQLIAEADGRSQPPPPPEPVVLTMNNQTAKYEATGTVWTWVVTPQGVDPPSGRPDLPDFPTDVPLNLLPYRNWDQQITAAAVPTCAPRTPDDVAAVCTWAHNHGYRVRPRGVAHGWSPFTLPTQPDTRPILLIDLTKGFASTQLLAASDGLPTRVRAGAGITMLALLEFLEQQEGGHGSAPGFAFPHTPAPGDLTLGGTLAIGAHGTAVPTPPEDAFAASYGSISNQVLDLTVVCTDPSNPSAGYQVKTIERGDPECKALLTHLGRCLVLGATLQVIDNYNLRCQSITDLPGTTIFAAPQPGAPTPPNSFAQFLQSNGRVEVIWFPFSDNPWLHLWQVAPTKPASSIAVDAPYNYPFADHVPDELQHFIALVLNGEPWFTPMIGQTAARITANGLDGKNWAGISGTYPVSRDIWGPSKNTLLYIQDTTLRVTANGYAIHIRRDAVQQTVHDLTTMFNNLLSAYASLRSYPVNSALELRVTALDDPIGVGVAGAESPVISALSMDDTDRANGWDTAVWFDVLTIPGTADSNAFYHELEQQLLAHFTGAIGRLLPEWSKGWAYTADSGPWTDATFIAYVHNALTEGRSSADTWAYESSVLAAHDAGGIFTNSFLDQLFAASLGAASSNASP